MRALVVILFVVLVLVIAWFAFGSMGPTRTRRRVVERPVVERPAARRVVRRRTTVVQESPDVVEERRIVE